MFARLPLKKVIFALEMFISIPTYSQNPVADGANSLGLSDTTVWSAVSNPANISSLAAPVAGFGARNSYLMPELNRYYAAAAFRARTAVVSADLQYHGFSVWKETSAGAAVSRKLGEAVSLSAKLSYLHVGHGEESPSDGFFLPQLFATVAVNEFSRFHAQLSPSVWTYGEKLPSREYVLSVGGSYCFSPLFIAFADGAMPETGKFRASAGCQYAVHRSCTVRLGAATDEYPLSAGVSAGKDAVWFDIACRYHRYLGAGLSCGLRAGL